MPARAPCTEVTAEVEAQTRFVRVARLMLDLAAATAPQDQAQVAALPPEHAKPAEGKQTRTKHAAAHASPAKPAARVRVAETTKDQGRVPAARASAKPSRNSSRADVRHAAAQ
jgi:hypothetical protein